MKKSIYYIGLDVHKETIAVTPVEKAGSAVATRRGDGLAADSVG